MSDVELDFNSVFPTLPKAILTKLEASYNEIKRNFRERRYEPSELNGAKFSEAVYRVLEWHTLKTFTAFGTKIRDFSQALRKFESMSSFPDSIRFHIPKLLDVLYGVRNKRGVGHLSNEIDPNHMDSIMVVSASDWVMAELVRVLHGTSN